MILRELLIKLGLEVDEAAFAKGQLTAALLESALHKVVDVATELVHSFEENIKEAFEYGNKVEKTSQQIGIATDALQELHYAGKLADLSAEEMSQSIGILSRHMQAAKKGGEEAAKAFKGITFKDGQELKPTEEVLASIADKFKEMDDGAEKTALALELFGRAGKKMIPLLNKGSEELAKMRQEARDLGLVMDDKSIKASEELNDNLERLHMITEGVWRQAVAPLIESLNELVLRFIEWRKENGKLLAQKLEKFARMLLWAFNRFADVLDVITEGLRHIHLFMPLILASAAALGVMMLYIKREAIAAAAAAVIAWGPVGLVFAGIAAAIAGFLLILEDFAVYQKGGKSLFGAFANHWDKWLEAKATDSWPVKQMKELLRLLGKAKEIIDQIDIFFNGKKQFMDRAYAQLAKEHPEYADEKGNYTGNRSVSYINGHLIKRTRGELKFGDEVVREAGSLNGNLDAGRYSAVKPELRTRAPELRVHTAPGGGSTTHVNAPVQVGPIVQRPGEDGEVFGQRVGKIVQDVLQGHIEAAIPAVKR